MRTGPLVLLALAAGCAAEEQRFRPANSPRGTAAYYELERDGRNWGDVKVWSPGSSELDDDKAVLDVRFRVRNDGEQPIDFDVNATYAELGVDGRFERVRPNRTGEAVSVAPGSVIDIPLTFALPPKIGPRDIDEAEVNWAIRTPNGRLTHSTLFVPLREERRVYYRPSIGLGFHYGHYRPWHSWHGRWYDDPFWP